MLPVPSLTNRGDRSRRNAIPARQDYPAAVALRGLAYGGNVRFSETGSVVPLSAHQRLGMSMGWVVVASENLLRMGLRSMAVASSKALWMDDRAVPIGGRVPSLPVAVEIVIGKGGQKQVVRANARRVITQMANCHADGNGSVSQCVSHAMGEDVASGELPVAIGVGRPRPKPTANRWPSGNVEPESGDSRGRILGLHFDLQCRGVTPPVVTAMRGLFAYNYFTK